MFEKLKYSNIVMDFLHSQTFDGKEVCMLSNSEIANLLHMSEENVSICLDYLKETGCVFIINLKRPAVRLIFPTVAGKELYKARNCI